MKTHDELKEIFENNFNCYSNTIDESIVLAMDCEQFIKVVSKILAFGKPEPLAKNKQCDDDFFCEWSVAHDMDNQKCDAQCIYCKSH